MFTTSRSMTAPARRWRRAAEPRAVGRDRPQRRGSRALQSVRRSAGRHIPRDRFDARAHEYSGRADVGARTRSSGPCASPSTRRANGRWRRSCSPTSDPRTFTAANLQYLIDSPTELSNFTLRTFSVDQEFRIALHHDGSDADADRFAAAVEKIVREERAIFGELPAFEVPYTFIADYLPWAAADGMEHRNSTILTAPHGCGRPTSSSRCSAPRPTSSFTAGMSSGSVPRSLEPFKLDAPNPSGELWFAEGFTSYYEPLVMRRAGLWSIDEFAGRIGYIARQRHSKPGAEIPQRRGSEPARAVRRPGGVERSDEFPTTTSCPTTLGRSHWPGSRSVAARANRSPGDARHYMRRLWQEFGRVAAAGGGRRRAAVHDPGSPRRARRGVWRPRVRGRLLRPLCSRTRGSSTIGRCWRARGSAAEAESGPRMDRSRVARFQRRHARGSARRPSKIRRCYARASIAATRSCRSMASPMSGPAAGGNRAAPQARRHGPHVYSPSAARPGAHDHDRGGPASAPRTRRTDRPPADRAERAFRDAWLESKQ